MENKPASNTEWIAWGKYDPLYGVSSYSERHKNGSDPWNEADFYAFGAAVWPHLHDVWSNYGISDGVCVEIGCGAGRITKQLALRFDEVHAFDVSEEMLGIARKNITVDNVTFHLNNGCAIRLPKASASTAFSTDVFQHFSDKNIADQYFAELGRVLSAGGTLMIHLPVYKWPSHARLFSRINTLLRIVQRFKYGVKRFIVRMGWMDPFMVSYQYEIPWLFDRLDAHGFENIELRIVASTVSRKRNNPKPFLFATRKQFDG